MITIISGTNRPNSKSLEISKHLKQIIQSIDATQDVQILNLEDVPFEAFNSDMYSAEGQHPQLTKIQDQYIIKSDKWIIVSPEYNGSYPGVLKFFIDAMSVKDYVATFKAKKAGLVGVSSGRAGNLRGMEHLAGALNYLGVTTMPNKLPISSVGDVLTDSGLAEESKETLTNYCKDFLAF